MNDLSFYQKVKDLCYIRRTMPEIITRREKVGEEDWFIIFDDIQGKLYRFSAGAEKIWEMMTGENSVERIVNHLLQTEGESKELTAENVCRFIAKAGKKGLIKAALKKV